MNGFPSEQNGHSAGSNQSGQQAAQILQALELIHDPRSKNELRQDASQYLEQIKAQDDAPYTGYVFAADRGYPPIVRHFGLSLLETAIRHRWMDYGEEQSSAVREWIIKLAQSVEKVDPLFVRNKIAQIWVEVAKRSWAFDWSNMDELLVELWAGSVAKKVLVLEILETLSENSFGKEDTVTALRGGDLSKACVDIFTPAHIMAENFPGRDTPDVRFGDEGWIWRISSLLGWCNEQEAGDQDVVLCAGKTLATLKSVVPWAILLALATTSCVQNVCRSLTFDSRSVQLAALETLYALYYRINYSDKDIHDLVGLMYEASTVIVLKEVYQWSVCPADDIDHEKYLLCKKFSETMHNVGKFLRDKPEALPRTADVPNFLDLLLQILQNESLHVSIPISHLFSQLLSFKKSQDLPEVVAIIGPLLQICSQRLIRYELLPEDSSHPAILFLAEDVDTMPERHAFLGNYARFGKEIVENIVKKRPYEALEHIITQADPVMRNPYEGQAPFNIQDYQKTSIAALKVDAQCSIIEAALAGYVRWRTEQQIKAENNSTNAQEASINSIFEKWSLQLMDLTYDDPAIQQRVLGLIVEFAIGPLKRDPEVALQVFYHLINSKIRLLRMPENIEAIHFQESYRDLQKFCSHQMQRIALRMPNDLFPTYDGIAEAVSQCFPATDIDEEDKDKCASVLFIIIQRTTVISDIDRSQRLEAFLVPFISKWSSSALAESLQSFSGFIDLLGLHGFQEYFLSRKAHSMRDWAEIPLDQEGLELKARIDAAKTDLPLRATKTFFGVSLERSEPGTASFKAAANVWSQKITTILPNLLQLIGLAHMFSEPSSWQHLPAESRSVPKRILNDRFWQVGISSGSRDDFYSKVEQTKTSLEGLASTIRGCLRFVRETSYRLISTMSLLGDALYRFEELPGPLSRAIFENSGALSTHQTSTLLEMIRPVISHCPSDARPHFLTPVLTAMFNALDNKIRTEWHRIDQQIRDESASDDLVEEMKDESILRQLTFNCVTLVATLFDPNDTGSSVTERPDTPRVSLRDYVLQTPEVFKSLIMFCTHALQMREGRACALITRVLRTLIPEFTKEDPVDSEIREFISTEVFRACITSFHDPNFVDVQNELAVLIASIMIRYCQLTNTPQQILLSLPDITNDKVEEATHKLLKTSSSSRQQRATILRLLEGLRGVSLSEQGRFPKPDPKKVRSAMQERYMTVEPKPETTREKTPDLGGMADMFA